MTNKLSSVSFSLIGLLPSSGPRSALHFSKLKALVSMSDTIFSDLRCFSSIEPPLIASLVTWNRIRMCFDPSDIPLLTFKIFSNEADHVHGSRSLGGSDELFGNLDSFFRSTGSHVILLFINFFFKSINKTIYIYI